MKEMLMSLLQAVIAAAVPVITVYLCKFLKTKKDATVKTTENETAKALLSQAFDAVCKAVTSTNQTYVDALKKSGTFTIENQKEAFQKSYETAVKIMSEEAKTFIATVYGSLNDWLTTQIEAQVKTQKDGVLTVGELITE